MRSIYITSKKKNLDLKTLESYLELKENLNILNFEVRSYAWKNNFSFYKENNDIFFNLGVFIYKNKFNSEALEDFYKDLKSGEELNTLLKSEETRGQFCLFLFYRNELLIISDKLGYFPLYYYQNEGMLDFSNSIIALAKNNNTTLNYLGVAEYLSENYKYLTYACCDQNIFNEIKLIDAGSIYKVSENNFKKETYFDLKKELNISKNNSLPNVVSSVHKLLNENLSFLKNLNINVHSDLTGGVDTRLILALLIDNGIKFSTGIQAMTDYKDFTNEGKYSELKIVDQISKIKNLNYKIYSDDKYLKKKELINNIAFYFSNKLTYDRRAGYFLGISEDDVNLIISGLSGTELFRLSYYQYFLKNKKLELKSFLNEYVELVDIMDDEFMDKEKYFKNLINYYEKNLENIKRKEDADLASYIDYFAFYRTHFCRYLNLANSIVPFYTPYGDFKLAKFMYETSYNLKSKFLIQRSILEKVDPKLASINSTRGFPLTTVKISNFYRFKNMIYRDIPQQYFSMFTKLKNFINLKLVKLMFKYPIIFKLLFSNKGYKEESKKKNLWGTPDDYSIISGLDEVLNKNLEVFKIINKNKLKKYVHKDCNYNILNRVLLLDKILQETKNK